MKIEIRTHAFLVQVCKLNCSWRELVNVFGGEERLANLFISHKLTDRFLDGIKEMLKSVPKVGEVDFTPAGVLFDEKTMDGFLRHFGYPNIASDVEELLKNMLRVVPDGNIGIELDEESAHQFSLLMAYRHEDLMILPEFCAPKYNTFRRLE